MVIPRFVSQMSIVPLVFRDWWEDFNRPVSRLMDQHFGTGLHRDDLISGFTGLGLNRPSIFGNTYYRPWRNVPRQNSSGSSTIQLDNNNFQVGICSNFALVDRNGTLSGLIRSKVDIRVLSYVVFCWFEWSRIRPKAIVSRAKEFLVRVYSVLRILRANCNFQSIFVLYLVFAE